MSKKIVFSSEAVCACGKIHSCTLDECIIGKGAVKQLPERIKKYNSKKAFILADINTFPIAGDKICKDLENCDIAFSKYIYDETRIEPDEKAVGSAVMHFDSECDIIIGIGSGVINDIGKILSKITGKPYIIIATAPSMDGYASATSSMVMDGLKVSLQSRCPDIIIGDTDILKTAPTHMLKSGLGDMIAKYVSICEWRISNLINDEYYCENIAEYIRQILRKCVENAAGLTKKEDKCIETVFEGLVASGKAMSYAGISRPASGIEHYISHIWDMRGLEFGTPTDLHGIQCAVGTLLSIRIYEKIKKIAPDKEKALKYAQNFDFSEWSKELSDFLGNSAKVMIAQEAKEGKYDISKHHKRLDRIAEQWNEILDIIKAELPTVAQMEKLLDTIDAPKELYELGIDENTLPMTFKATKDIRDKYVLSRLACDLGIIDEILES